MEQKEYFIVAVLLILCISGSFGIGFYLGNYSMAKFVSSVALEFVDKDLLKNQLTTGLMMYQKKIGSCYTDKNFKVNLSLGGN